MRLLPPFLFILSKAPLKLNALRRIILQMMMISKISFSCVPLFKIGLTVVPSSGSCYVILSPEFCIILACLCIKFANNFPFGYYYVFTVHCYFRDIQFQPPFTHRPIRIERQRVSSVAWGQWAAHSLAVAGCCLRSHKFNVCGCDWRFQFLGITLKSLV